MKMKSLLLIPAAVAVVAVSACGSPKTHTVTRTVYTCPTARPHATVTHHHIVAPQPTRTVTHKVVVHHQTVVHHTSPAKTKVNTTKSKSKR